MEEESPVIQVQKATIEALQAQIDALRRKANIEAIEAPTGMFEAIRDNDIGALDALLVSGGVDSMLHCRISLGWGPYAVRYGV